MATQGPANDDKNSKKTVEGYTRKIIHRHIVLTRKFSIGSMAGGFVYLIGVILTFFVANLSHLTS